MNKAYISLGSNEGQRLKNIQEAVVHVQKKIGTLTKLSSLYKTPSWGFDGPEFINTCIEVQTPLSPTLVLDQLLKIELKLGRVRTVQSGYISRNIDLDLLFYEDLVLESEGLILPHPRLALRNFILIPMCEMEPGFVHSGLGKSMEDLLKICKDHSQLHKMPLHQWAPDLFDADQFLAFEGNIGVGKTSLAQKIASDYGVPKLLENFTQNPYLEKFYDQPQRFALPLENYFLEDRFRQFRDFKQKIGSADHSFFKSLIFAQINLSKTDFLDFKQNYERLSAQLEVPQKIIFLYKPIEEVWLQIKSRGRSYEQNIRRGYLQEIELGYQNFLKSEKTIPHMSIDLTDIDFVNNERDYQLVLQRIKAF